MSFDRIVVEHYELSKNISRLLKVSLTLECVRILSWFIIFFCTSVVSLMMFCIRLLSELMILLLTHHVTNHLTCSNKLKCMDMPASCNMILKINIPEKCFCFWLATFWFWSVKIWYYRDLFKLKLKNCYPELV